MSTPIFVFTHSGSTFFQYPHGHVEQKPGSFDAPFSNASRKKQRTLNVLEFGLSLPDQPFHAVRPQSTIRVPSLSIIFEMCFGRATSKAVWKSMLAKYIIRELLVYFYHEILDSLLLHLLCFSRIYKQFIGMSLKFFIPLLSVFREFAICEQLCQGLSFPYLLSKHHATLHSMIGPGFPCLFPELFSGVRLTSFSHKDFVVCATFFAASSTLSCLVSKSFFWSSPFCSTLSF